MKNSEKIIVLLCSLLTLNTFSQSCLPEGIVFETQAQVDSFQINYPGCTEIEGDVTINGGFNITNLNGLNVLTNIKGDLDISDNYSLESLTGLDNIVSIGGMLLFHTNTGLFSLTGLENLDSIGGELGLVFYMNPQLNSISGLQNLSHIDGQLWIEYCHSLSNLNGLNNLLSIDGRLVIRHNPNLCSLAGLENVNSVNGYIEIWYNHELSALAGLNGLNSINGDLIIVENDMLSSLDGLENIDANTIQDLSIRVNPQLSYCAVQSICDYLASPNGTIEIEQNQSGCNNKNQVVEACGIWPGAEDLSEDKQQFVITIYPNPAKDLITLDPKPGIKTTSIEIIDMQGKVVMHQKIANDMLSFNTGDLPQGFYLVRVIGNQGVEVQKLVIQ